MVICNLEVMNPVAELGEKMVLPAARLKDLNNKKIGLFWNTKQGGDAALKRTEELLSARYEGIVFEYFTYRLPTVPQGLKAVMDSHCDAVVATNGD